MAVYKIPISTGPQTFTVTLNSIEYTMTLIWRDATMGGWFLDIADAYGNPIVCGIALVTGANLFAQYEYLGFPGILYVQTSDDVDAVPTYDNLGDGAYMYFVI